MWTRTDARLSARLRPLSSLLACLTGAIAELEEQAKAAHKGMFKFAPTKRPTLQLYMNETFPIALTVIALLIT
jgi:hypothetical protein